MPRSASWPKSQLEPTCCQCLRKGIERNRDEVHIKVLLSLILDIVFQYGDVVVPLPLINYKDCKTEPLELSPIVGMIYLHCHLLKDLVGLPSKS